MWNTISLKWTHYPPHDTWLLYSLDGRQTGLLFSSHFKGSSNSHVFPIVLHSIPERFQYKFILYYVDGVIFLPLTLMSRGDCVAIIIATIEMFISLGFYHSPNQGNTRPSPEISFFRICAWLSSYENLSCTRKEHESYFSLFRALSKQMFYCVSSFESRWEYDMQLPRGHARTSLLFKFNLYLGERLWSVIDHLQ